MYHRNISEHIFDIACDLTATRAQLPKRLNYNRGFFESSQFYEFASFMLRKHHPYKNPTLDSTIMGASGFSQSTKLLYAQVCKQRLASKQPSNVEATRAFPRRESRTLGWAKFKCRWSSLIVPVHVVYNSIRTSNICLWLWGIGIDKTN